MDAEFDLIVLPLPASTPTFGDAGMNNARIRQLRVIQGIFNHATIFGTVISGCDFRFYRKITAQELIPESGIYMTKDAENVFCTDLIAATKYNWDEGILDLWIRATELGSFSDDQVALNWAIKAMDFPVKTLAPDRFWNLGAAPDLVRCPWQPGDLVPEPPEGMAMMHGNFTIGVENKLALLEAVRLKVAARKQ